MQRRQLFRGATAAASVAGAAGLLSACRIRRAEGGAVSSLPRVRWRMATSWPHSLDTIFGGAETVSRRVEEVSGGLALAVVLVVLGDQLGVSVGDLFMGSLIPDLLMAAAFAISVVLVSSWKPQLALPLIVADTDRLGPAGLARVLLAPLALILLVLLLVILFPPLVTWLPSLMAAG